jgi:ferric-dicitrate binding protein FerR (iron transport regulator)
MNKNNIDKHLDFIFESTSKNSKKVIDTFNNSKKETIGFNKIYRATKSNIPVDSFASGNLNELWNRIDKRHAQRSKKGIYYFVSSIVAILIIGFLVFNQQIYENKTDTIIYTSVENKIFYLEDGTKVYVKPNSKIIIPNGFSAHNRNIKLSYGEAFFEVAHNKKFPFLITNQKYKVRVLGTKFNLRSIESEDYISTSLQEGKVEILYENQKLATLNPNDKLIYNKLQNNFKLNRYSNEVTFFWKNNTVEFDDVRLIKIIQNLAIHYNKEVIISQSFKSNSKFRGVFQNKSLEYILDILMRLDDFKYQVNNNKIIVLNK